MILFQTEKKHNNPTTERFCQIFSILSHKNRTKVDSKQKKIGYSQLFFLTVQIDFDCNVRKSHLQQGLLRSHEGGASIVVVTVSGMWYCTLDGWMEERVRKGAIHI